MRVAVATTFATALSWWSRLQAEGHDVRVWIQPPSHKGVGDGIIPKAGQWPELLAWAKEGARAGIPTIVLIDSSGIGERADEARKAGLHVVGGGSFADRLEKDRKFGQAIAENAGCLIPPYQSFGSIAECLAAVPAMGDTQMYFKTDRYLDSDTTHGADSGEEMAEYLEGLVKRYGGHGECIIQERIKGVPLSTARWWNGSSWVGPYEGTYENKKLMNDDIGPATGCSFNAIWFYEDEEPQIARLLGFESAALAFRKHQAPPGLYDINAIVTDEGEAYFLEWTPRFGYDSEPTSQRLIPDLGKHLWAVATGHDVPDWSDELAYSIRLSIPPYPWEHGEKREKGTADGTPIKGIDGLWDGNFIAYLVRDDPDGEIVADSPEGIVGLALATGDALSDLHEECVEFAKTIRVSGTSLQFRTDGDEDTAEKAEALVSAGFEIHEGLLT